LCYIVPTAMAEDKPAEEKPESAESTDAKKPEAKKPEAKKSVAKAETKESKPSSPGKPGAAKSGKADANPAKFDPKPVNVGGESILERLLPHLKKIAIAAAIIIGIVMIAVVVVWWKDKKVVAATGRVVKVVDVYDRVIRAPGAPADPSQPSFATEAERANAVVDAIGKNEAEKVNPAFRGAQLVNAGRIDEAIVVLRGAQRDAGLDGVLARENLGLALEAKAATEKDPTARQKDLEEALKTFQEMQPDPKGPRGAYALYHQGRMLSPELLNKPAEARTAFQKAKDVAKDTDLPELIEERLALLGDS
jgi:hypothetical protein